jgi:hypothetical protein
MENKKLSVIPTLEQIEAANKHGEEIAKLQSEVIASGNIPDKERLAAEEMARRTEEQLKKREELLAKGESLKSHLAEDVVEVVYSEANKKADEKVNKLKASILEISQPRFNDPFDIIPLPSEGKVYKNKNGRVKVAFLTTSDENVLTSPNLVESDDFLEILINRKLLETDLRYEDLLPGDRDAIMIWLRATGYGEMYPVTILDEKGEQFETEVNLEKLPIINLTVNPDEDGLFPFTLPKSMSVVRFKLLTIKDIRELESSVTNNKTGDEIVNTDGSAILEAHIVEIDGNKDRTFIHDFVERMRVLDGKKLKEYIESISCGVDTKLTFRTPGGGSVERFLPFTAKFFWPDYEL